MEILYLVFDSITSPIVKSQVFEMCDRIVEKSDFNFKIFTVEENVANLSDYNKRGIELISAKGGNRLFSYCRFVKAILRECSKQDQIIHVRSYEPMLIAILVKRLFKAKIIFDMRGLLPEEHIYLNNKSKKSLMYKCLKYAEKQFIKKSDEIVVVSDQFKEYITNKYQISENISTIYCSANDKEKSDKTALTYDDLKDKYHILEEQILITYVGSFYKYQNVESIMNFISDLSKETKIKFIIFTPTSKKEVGEIIDAYDIDEEDVEVDFVPNDVLVNYLKYFDYGIIIRDNDIINQVSSPIKISEYIINDMKILYSGEIGDFNQLLPRFDVGLDISEYGNYKNKVLKIKPNYRNEDEVKKIVGYDFNSEKYIEIYENIFKRR